MNKQVLVIAAHSDDEAIGCSGTLMRHVDEGDKVFVMFMTDGVMSRIANENDRLKRNDLAKCACEKMGVEIAMQCDFPDNKMDSIPLLDVVKAIENVIMNIKPEIIYTHHAGDLNIDHQITHNAVITACRPQPGSSVKEIYAFEVLSSSEWGGPSSLSFIPNIYIDVTKYFNKKEEVLRIYNDEMRDVPHSRSISNILRLMKFRGNSVGLECAEAFMLLRLIK